jgi:hypothetical protein
MIVAARRNLSDVESRELQELLSEYGDMFVMMNGDYGRINRVFDPVGTGAARPMRQQPRRPAFLSKASGNRQQRGVIEL